MKNSIRLLMLAAMSLGLSAPVLANSIAIGTLVYAVGDSVGQPAIQVNNLTGAQASTLAGCGGTVTGPGTYCYPVLTPLTFENVSLTVQYTSGGGPVQTLAYNLPASDNGWFTPSYAYCGTFGVDGNCGDPAYPFHVPGVASLLGGDVDVLAATFSGTVSPASFQLNDFSLFDSTGIFSATLNPATDCAACSWGEQTDIVLQQAAPTSEVPEPASVVTLLSGIGVLAEWRRRATA